MATQRGLPAILAEAIGRAGLLFFRGDLSAATAGRSAGSYSLAGRDPAEAFGRFSARSRRYEFLEAMSASAAYSDELCRFAAQVRGQFATSSQLRPVLNPVQRIVEFWRDHLYGYRDPAMGDGRRVPTAYPILGASDATREALGMICEDSNWDEQQSLYAGIGPEVGDVALFSNNDLAARRCYVEVVHPRNVIEYCADPRGRGLAYTYVEWADDPRPRATGDDTYGYRRQVLYVEQAEVTSGPDGVPGGVRFRTFLKGDGLPVPYSWAGSGASEWTEDYPELPLVLVPHRRVLPRCPFGEAEAGRGIAKMIESDDVASRFHSFVRKAVDPVVLFTGMTEPERKLRAPGSDSTLRALYASNPGANAKMLLAALDLAAVDGHIDRLIAEIERDYPELRDLAKASQGDASGTALRLHLQSLQAKGTQRRAGYDAGLCTAWRRCLVMGGMEGYDGYEDFAPEKLASDPALLRFSIGDRGLFKKDPLDELDVTLKRAQVLESYDRAGVPIDAAMGLLGFSADDMAEVMAARERDVASGLPVGRMQAQPRAADANTAAADQAPGGPPATRQNAPGTGGA